MVKHSSDLLKITCLSDSMVSINKEKEKEIEKEDSQDNIMEHNLSPIMHVQVQNGGEFKVI